MRAEFDLFDLLIILFMISYSLRIILEYIQ